MSKKIIVFATSFLSELLTHPEKELEPLTNLKAAADRHGLDLVLHCDRDSGEPISVQEIQGAVAVIADLEPWPNKVLRQVGRRFGGELEIIARYGAGTSNIDAETAADAGILLTNTPAANAVPTAEWAVSTLLDVAGRRTVHHNRAGRGLGKTGRSRLDVSNGTLGIIGTGSIGKSVARLLSGFNMKLIASDPYPDRDWAEQCGAEYTDVKSLCRLADFITVHASGTVQIINSDMIDLMNANTVLVNCARGHLVDNAAAYRAVREGRLYGYGIDEIWNHSDLLLSPGLNLAVSPHVGSDTDRGILGMRKMSADAIVDFLDGRMPVHAVNKAGLK
ncbi:MAG: NAD(P)-dependent oxidoreductase [Spirochaetaceae bacterium]|nr:NAD(P)-dependent oxidoreductase [Spirochaetaceae bacterium]